MIVLDKKIINILADTALSLFFLAGELEDTTMNSDIIDSDYIEGMYEDADAVRSILVEYYKRFGDLDAIEIAMSTDRIDTEMYHQIYDAIEYDYDKMVK